MPFKKKWMSDSMQSSWYSAISLEYLRGEHVQTFLFLPLYLFFLVEASQRPQAELEDSRWYFFGIGLLVFYIVSDFLDNKYFEGNTLFTEIKNFLNQFSTFNGLFCVVLFCLDQLVKAQTTFVYSFLLFIVPLSAYMCYQELIQNNQIQTDSWQPISSKITELARKGRNEGFGKVVCLLPEGSNTKHPYGGYKYITPKNVNRMNLNSGNHKIGTNYSTQSAPFFILDADALNKNPKEFIPFSEEALSNLTRVALTNLPPKIDHINMVTQAHLLIAQWFEYSPKDNASFFSREMYNIQLFLGRRKKTMIMIDHEQSSTETSNKSTIKIAHVWKQEELCFAAKLLVDSVVDKDSPDHLSRISDVFLYRMKNLNEHNGGMCSAASRFIALLSIGFSKAQSENSSFSQLAMLESFSRACKILFAEYDLKSSIEECRTRAEFARLLKTHLFIVLRCQQNPVESFIKNHDAIVHDGEHEVGGKAYSTLSQIVHGMMEELQKTSFQRTLVQESRFDASELIDIRNGIVSGTAVALELMTKITKAG